LPYGAKKGLYDDAASMRKREGDDKKMRIEQPVFVDSPIELNKPFEDLNFSDCIWNGSRGGTLLVVEGIDGSGKTTLAYQIARALSGFLNEHVLLTAEPTINLKGGLAILTKKHAIKHPMDRRFEAIQLSMDHAIHLAKIVIPALSAGMIVICDRWFWSSYCYQVERLEEVGDPEPLEFLRELHKGWDVIPDATFYLKLPVNIAMSRIQSRADELHDYEKEEFLARVAKRYDKLCCLHDFVLLDGEKSTEELLYEAMEICINRITANRRD